jgi:RimJ/RimL family protein N-acetyltransferase
MELELRPASLRDLEPPSEALAAGLAHGFASLEAGLETARDVLRQFESGGAAPPWSAYWGWESGDDAPAGVCGFKGAPAADGSVEIAYFTFPQLEGRGVAGAMAAGLLAVARRGGASAVAAHTLPERNASCAILEKHGFRFLGETEDPEDGPVWGWRLDL